MTKLEAIRRDNRIGSCMQASRGRLYRVWVNDCISSQVIMEEGGESRWKGKEKGKDSHLHYYFVW
jgi:hypothetical protein